MASCSCNARPDAGAASCVKAPLIGECYANLACRVVDRRLATQCNIFILEALKAWIDPSKKTPSGRFCLPRRPDWKPRLSSQTSKTDR